MKRQEDRRNRDREIVEGRKDGKKKEGRKEGRKGWDGGKSGKKGSCVRSSGARSGASLVEVETNNKSAGRRRSRERESMVGAKPFHRKPAHRQKMGRAEAKGRRTL